MFKISKCLIQAKNSSGLFLKFQLLTSSSFNFAENNKSFLDKVRAKFNLKKEDNKIDVAGLKNRDEESDKLNSSKLENEEDFTEDLQKFKNILTDAERQQILNDLEGERFNKHIEDKEFAELKIVDKNENKDLDKLSTLENLERRYGIDTTRIQLDIKEDYNRLNFKEDILPKIEQLNKLGFTNEQLKVIVHKMDIFLLNPSNIEKISQFRDFLKNHLNLSEDETLDILSCIPNIVEMQNNKVEKNISTTKEFYKIEQEEALKNLFIQYPLLITNLTSDLPKILFYFNLYLEMSKEDFVSLAERFPLILTITADNTLNIFKTVDRMKFDRKEWRALIEKDPRVYLFRHTQMTNVVSLLRYHGVSNKEAFEIIKQYPDFLLANRYDLLRKKFALFNQLKLNKSTIRNLIKLYPFIMLKSYNSFVNKVFYFHQELKMDIEDIDIYPLIYVYNLQKDIKPRCELMKKYNKWLPFNEAFSMSIEDLAEKLNVKAEDKAIKPSDASPLQERDLLFRYSKYHTI